MQLYGGGHKFVTDQKVNIDNSLYKTITANDSMADVLGRNLQIGQKNLVAFRDNSGPNDNNLTASYNGSGIVFGGDDTAAVLSVDGWGKRRARIGWQSAYTNKMWHEDIAWKSDVTTKTINQDVDINTLTDEGNFFVESNNLNHFPANYQSMWYFLNVESTIDHSTSGRIKQTVVPDNTGQDSWMLTRTGLWQNNGSVAWRNWLISDFANGKLLKSK